MNIRQRKIKTELVKPTNNLNHNIPINVHFPNYIIQRHSLSIDLFFDIDSATDTAVCRKNPSAPLQESNL